MHSKDILRENLNVWEKDYTRLKKDYERISSYEDDNYIEAFINPWTGEIKERRISLRTIIEQELADLKEFLTEEEFQHAVFEELSFRKSQEKKSYCFEKITNWSIKKEL